MLAARFNRQGHEIVDHHTFVIASDGDIEEGIGREACSLAGHLGLGRLIVFYDDNHISLDGPTELSFSEDVGKRFEAYGWHVQDLGRGHRRSTTIEEAIRRRQDVDGPAVADRSCARTSATAPEQAGHGRGARLAARRGGGAS